MRKPGLLLKLVVALLAVGYAGVTIWRWHAEVHTATAEAELGVILLFSIIDFAEERGAKGHRVPRKMLWTIALSLYRGVRAAVLLLAVVSLPAAALMFIKVSGAEQAHLRLEGHTIKAVHDWAQQTRVFLLVSTISIIGLVGYGIWKFVCTRFSDSRLGILRVLLEKTRTIRSTESDTKKAVRLAQDLCVQYLARALSLSGWAWLQSIKLPGLRRVCTRVELLHFDDGEGVFKTIAVSHPPAMPNGLLDAYEQLRNAYRPRAFNEALFAERVGISKGQAERGWERRFLNQADRASFTSAAGWVAHSRKTLQVDDADFCLMFAPSPAETPLSPHFQGEVARWLEIRSFIASPVYSFEAGALPLVLFASKNVRYGLPPEDTELVEAVAHILSMVGGRRRSDEG